MMILGAAFFGTLAFLGVLFTVVLFGAAGNKWGKDIQQVTDRERANGIVDDVTRNGVAGGTGPYVHAPA